MGRPDLARPHVGSRRARDARRFSRRTARPEFRPPWSLRPHHGVISLAPLDRAQVCRMIGELASGHVLSSEVVEGVGERTGGVPLFVEEVTRLLLERGEVGGLQAIPPTLQQSLAARLDRLAEAREVAQIEPSRARSRLCAARRCRRARGTRPPVRAYPARRRRPPVRRGRRPRRPIASNMR